MKDFTVPKKEKHCTMHILKNQYNRKNRDNEKNMDRRMTENGHQKIRKNEEEICIEEIVRVRDKKKETRNPFMKTDGDGFTERFIALRKPEIRFGSKGGVIPNGSAGNDRVCTASPLAGRPGGADAGVLQERSDPTAVGDMLGTLM